MSLLKSLLVSAMKMFMRARVIKVYNIFSSVSRILCWSELKSRCLQVPVSMIGLSQSYFYTISWQSGISIVGFNILFGVTRHNTKYIFRWQIWEDVIAEHHQTQDPWILTQWKNLSGLISIFSGKLFLASGGHQTQSWMTSFLYLEASILALLCLPHP